MFRSFYGSAGFYPGHGSGVRLSASPGYPHVSIPGRLATPVLFSSSSSPGTGDSNPSMSGPWNCGHLGKVQSNSIAEEAMLNRRRILVLRRTGCLFVEKAVRNSVISDLNCSGGKATDAIPSTSPSPSMESEGRLHLDSLGSRMSPRFGMVDGSEPSSVGHLPS